MWGMRSPDRRALNRRDASFVIRLWLETRKPGFPPEWRWHVIHVQSGHERYGYRLADLMDFIGDKSGAEPPSMT